MLCLLRDYPGRDARNGAYTETDEQRAFHGQILEGLKALPGVTAAGTTWALPLGRRVRLERLRAGDRPGSEPLGIEI
jgi:hypothetical protein